MVSAITAYSPGSSEIEDCTAFHLYNLRLTDFTRRAGQVMRTGRQTKSRFRMLLLNLICKTQFM